MTAVALVACSAAGADPAASAGGGAARPPGWKQQPSMATAVSAAARANGVVIDAVDAWGDPAAGCHAIWLALHGGAGDAPALAEQVLEGLRSTVQSALPGGPAAAKAGARPGISISEVAKPTGPTGVLALGFARPPYRGRVRAQLGGGRITAIACFANQREPVACEAACALVLRGVP